MSQNTIRAKRTSRFVGSLRSVLARTSRLQSAMEYLMTYGWAILILAVVVGVLFQLGVFNSSTFAGTSCIGSSGFLCQNPTLVTSGMLTFTFGQNIGSPMYNVQLACAASMASGGTPNPITAFNSISSTGVPLIPAPTGNTLVNGQTMIITSLPCYDSTGAQITNPSMGSSYSGYIWVNYTKLASAESAATNPWLTTRPIVIKTKVV